MLVNLVHRYTGARRKAKNQDHLKKGQDCSIEGVNWVVTVNKLKITTTCEIEVLEFDYNNWMKREVEL